MKCSLRVNSHRTLAQNSMSRRYELLTVAIHELAQIPRFSAMEFHDGDLEWEDLLDWRIEDIVVVAGELFGWR